MTDAPPLWSGRTADLPSLIARLSHEAAGRIGSHIHHTPLIPATDAGEHAGTSLLFKAENVQRTGSFKIRGALTKLTSLAAGGTAGGAPPDLITASSGNHGIATARAAAMLGRRLTVLLPETVAAGKLEAIRSYGVEVILHGGETGAAELHAQDLARAADMVYVSPYNDLDIIAGQGTIGIELVEALGAGTLDHVFVAIGGGGLIGGIGSVLKALSPKTKVWGVSAANSAALHASLQAGRIVEVDHAPTLADAVAGGVDEGAVTLPVAQAVVDELLICREEEIEDALVDLALREHQVVEGAAALAYAGFRQTAGRRSGTCAVVLCGGNIDAGTLVGLLGRRLRTSG